MRNNCFSKKNVSTSSPPPRGKGFQIFLHQRFFLNVGNSINIKTYTAHPHDMVHVPAKFREYTSMRFRVTVRKLNVTDRQTHRQTDGRTGGVAISPVQGLRHGGR